MQNGQRQLEHVDVEQFGRLPQRGAARHALTAAIYVQTLVHPGHSFTRVAWVKRTTAGLPLDLGRGRAQWQLVSSRRWRKRRANCTVITRNFVRSASGR